MMTRKSKRYAVGLLKQQLKPTPPFYNINDLHGRHKHALRKAMQSGQVGSFSGISIVMAPND